MDSRQVMAYATESSQGVWGWVRRRLQPTNTTQQVLPAPPTTTTDSTPSKGRNKSSYAQNKTASLSLPEDSINDLNSRRHRAQPLTSYALINDTIDWVSGYLPDFSKKKPKIVYEFVVEDPDSPIIDHITSLETRILKITEFTKPYTELSKAAQKKVDGLKDQINNITSKVTAGATLSKQDKEELSNLHTQLTAACTFNKKFADLSEADQKKVDEFNRQKVILLKEEIKEHAYRRVEMFFYMLIAVWRQNIQIEKKGGAIAQHGTGSKERGTAGCHSFPFTNLKFTKLPGKFDWLNGPKPLLTLEQTHFIETINSTMELPVPVNQFDKHFEGMFGMSNRMKEALELLNKCARNEITPIEGITQFFMIMDGFFKHHDNKYIQHADKNKIDYPETMKKIWEYEQDGTFNATFNQGTLVPSDEFLAMTLGMSVGAVKSANTLPGGSLAFNEAYKRIQNEIYNSEPVEAHKASKGAKP